MDPTTQSIPLKAGDQLLPALEIKNEPKEAHSAKRRLKNIARMLKEELSTEHSQEQWPQRLAFRTEMVANALNIQADWEARFSNFTRITKLRVKLTGEHKTIQKLVRKIRLRGDCCTSDENRAKRLQQILETPDYDAFKAIIEQNAIREDLKSNQGQPVMRSIIYRLIELKTDSKSEEGHAYSQDLDRMLALLLEQEASAGYFNGHDPERRDCLYLAIQYGLVEQMRELLVNWHDDPQYPNDDDYQKILLEVLNGQTFLREGFPRNYYLILFSLLSIVQTNESPESLKILELLLQDAYGAQARNRKISARDEKIDFPESQPEIFEYLILFGKKEALTILLNYLPQGGYCFTYLPMVSLVSKVLQHEQVRDDIFELFLEKIVLCTKEQNKELVSEAIKEEIGEILVSAVYYTKYFLDVHSSQPTPQGEKKINKLLACIRLIAHLEEAAIDVPIHYHKTNPMTRRWNQWDLTTPNWNQWAQEISKGTAIDLAEGNPIILQALQRTQVKSSQKLTS